MEDTTVQKKN